MKQVSGKTVLYFFILIFVTLAACAWISHEANKPWDFGLAETVVNRIKSPIEVIEQVDGSKLVRNVEEGFEVTVPGGWHIDATKTQFYSPEFMKGTGGCKITQGIRHKQTTIEELRQKLEESTLESFNPNEIEMNKFEMIKVAGIQGIKVTLKTYLGYSVSTYLVTPEKEYYFIMYFDSPDYEKCMGYLDVFLKTIVVK